MRNGTLPFRILHDLRRDGVAAVRSGDLVGRYGSAATVSRALGKLVRAEHLEPLERGFYRVLPQREPRLAFDRAWSNPGAKLDPDHRIAVTLARPTFRDVVRLCEEYGVPRVRRILDGLADDNEIPAPMAEDWRHRLGNIERGFRDATHQLHARGSQGS